MKGSMTRSRHISSKRRGSQGGNAFIEFALGATVLVAMFTGTFQFGYAFYTYNNLQNAVRAGASFAAMEAYDSNSTTPSTAFKTAVENVVVYGNRSGTGRSIVPGLTAANVNFTPVFTNNVPSAMTVSVTGFTINAIFSSFSLTNKPQVTMPYYGRYSPP
jgi:Flp pilus assembly protein TadG